MLGKVTGTQPHPSQIRGQHRQRKSSPGIRSLARLRRNAIRSTQHKMVKKSDARTSSHIRLAVPLLLLSSLNGR